MSSASACSDPIEHGALPGSHIRAGPTRDSTTYLAGPTLGRIDQGSAPCTCWRESRVGGSCPCQRVRRAPRPRGPPSTSPRASRLPGRTQSRPSARSKASLRSPGTSWAAESRAGILRPCSGGGDSRGSSGLFSRAVTTSRCGTRSGFMSNRWTVSDATSSAAAITRTPAACARRSEQRR